jgi:hypothetical protein
MGWLVHDHAMGMGGYIYADGVRADATTYFDLIIQLQIQI